MRRLLPSSFAVQMALLVGIALLVAQAVNFALLVNEREKLSLLQNQTPAITRFVDVVADFNQAAPEFRDPVLQDASRRGARFELTPASRVPEAQRDSDAEDRLRSALASGGITGADVRAADEGRTSRNGQALRLEVRQGDGRWLSGRMITSRRGPLLATRLVMATVLVFVIVLGVSILIAIRLARPLRDLTRAAESFAGRGEPQIVRPRGPDDLKIAIEAFNAMNRRLLALLDEKDRMLGAIGHDLRTPLASLRLRVEGLEPEEEREAAVAKIEEMTAMLEDILILARSGRAREEAREMDVTSLVESLVEDYRSLGRQVSFASGERQVLAIQPNLLRRAVRNLIDNAVKYAGAAEVSVAAVGNGLEIAVRDIGPGIPDEQRERVLEPFYRLESSRSRETGGSGLGLAIAGSVAESHGGTLRLEPNQPYGLVAIISLPRTE